MGFLDRHAAKFFGLMRIITGLFFLMLGLMQVADLVEPYTHGPLPWINVIVWIAGGALVATGLFSRRTSVLLAAFMVIFACAEWLRSGIAPGTTEIELDALSVVMLLVCASVGPGAFAVNTK